MGEELVAPSSSDDAKQLSANLKRRRDAINRHFEGLEKRIQKVEAYQAANLELAVDMFKKRIEILDAMSENWRDKETGEFSPDILRRGSSEVALKLWFHELQNIEKQAGLIPTKKEQRTVVVTLADRWKQLKGEYEDEFIDAEAYEDE